MEYETVVVRKEGGIAFVTLNRPQALNALNEQVLNDLVAALAEVEKDDSVHVAILGGEGKAFSAGRDLEGILAGTEMTGGARYKALEGLSKPIIAAVQGFCFTGSFELAMCADLIVASEDAVFCDTHARFGILPGGGQTQRLPRLIGPRKAKELLFTCRRVDAREAERLGIVNRVVPRERLLEEATKMAEEILENIPETVSRMKALIDRGLQGDLEAGLWLEASQHQGPISPTAEGRRRMQALLRKR